MKLSFFSITFVSNEIVGNKIVGNFFESGPNKSTSDDRAQPLSDEGLSALDSSAWQHLLQTGQFVYNRNDS
jgi:hypothetical protein